MPIDCDPRGCVVRNSGVNAFLGAACRAGWVQRAFLLGVVRMLLAMAVLCGPLQAGAHYFYCEALGLSATDPCATGPHTGDTCPSGSWDRQSMDCCSIVILPSMPEGAPSSEHAVPPAGVVAKIPAAEYACVGLENRSETFAPRAPRWQKPPRGSGGLRAQLMVFLT